MNTRRSLLTTTALLPVALLPIGACTALQSVLGMTPAQWATDVSVVAGWMPSITDAVAALGVKVPANTLADINKYAALVKTDAAAVATATAAVVTGTSTGAIVREIVQTIGAIADVVLPFFPIGSLIRPVIDAMVAMEPEFAAACGLTGAPLRAPVYTVDQARAILNAPQPAGVLAK